MSDAPCHRLEHDSLGEIPVPAHAYYGVQTMRAVQNFPISGVDLSHLPTLLRALAMVKDAAAHVNHAMGYLPEPKRAAIAQAATEIAAGALHDHFPIDVMQGGAGTSTNMNMNEVLANRGLEIMGHARGEYQHLHPNDDVNLSQSTNDAYPTAVRLGVLMACAPLQAALETLAAAFERKSEQFTHVVKLGRTQLQDAVPMTLGQELGAYAVTIREDVSRIEDSKALLSEVNLGGTAIGTRINAPAGYGPRAIAELSRYRHVRISRVVWTEILAGEPPEQRDVITGLLEPFDIVEIDDRVAIAAADIRFRSRMKLMDAYIFATSQVHGAILVTRNTKDFPADMPGIRVPYSL